MRRLIEEQHFSTEINDNHAQTEYGSAKQSTPSEQKKHLHKLLTAQCLTLPLQKQLSRHNFLTNLGEHYKYSQSTLPTANS